jgi:hypothetical protein
VLELSTSSFTVQGTTTDGATSAFLTLTNGTFKISGTFTGTHRTFNTAAYTIPHGRVLAQQPELHRRRPGQLGNEQRPAAADAGHDERGPRRAQRARRRRRATFTIEGGTLNIASRLQTTNAVTYSQSGGTVNATTVGNGTT